MRKLLQKLFGIQENEVRRAWLMFGYIFLVVASLLMVKPAAYSLFLVEFGPQQLPYAFILVAIVSILVASIYTHLTKRIPISHIISTSIIVFFIFLLFFWMMLHSGYKKGWFIYTFYIWVAIFGVLSASQFWLLANYVFNVREAKRVFGFLGLGAITGGIFGGYLTKFLAPVIGTENLIFLCLGFILICLVILRLVWTWSIRRTYLRREARGQRLQQSVSTSNPIHLILKSRHLTYLAAIIGLGVLVANLVDYQFSAIASKTIPDEDRLTAFFGFWYSNLSVASLVVQIFLTSRFLRVFGVGVSLFLLPVGILIGAAAILLVPCLVTAILIKMNEGGLKHSINKAGIELLALSIPAGIKKQVKSFIDIFVTNTATGIAGLSLFIIAPVLGLGVPQISIVIIGLIVVWLVLIHRVKGEYINSFRLAIERRTIDIHDPTINLNDAAVFNSIQQVLEGQNERQILYALRLIEDSTSEVYAPFLEQLIVHPSSEVKAQALRMAIGLPNIDLSKPVRDLIDHKTEDVRIQAIHYLCRSSPDRLATLSEYLNSSDIRVQTAAMLCTAMEYRHNPSIRQELDITSLYRSVYNKETEEELLDSEVIFYKVSAARVIGEANVPDLFPHLHELLEYPSNEVKSAAVQSAGRTASQEFTPRLIEFLESRSVRRFARLALAQYGDEILEDLICRLKNPNGSIQIRLEVPKILALIGSQKSVSALLDNLNQEDLVLHHEVIKALNKLRVGYQELRFPLKRIQNSIIKEVENYYQLLALQHQHRNVLSRKSPGESASSVSAELQTAQRLMTKVIQERLDDGMESIFRLLALKYPPDDIYNAYRGITTSKSEHHINAVEFLDNLLDPTLRQYIVPIVESHSIDALIRSLADLYGPAIPSGVEYLSLLLEGSDTWLKVCALFVIAHSRQVQWTEIVNVHARSPVAIISETAKYAVQRLKKVV